MKSTGNTQAPGMRRAGANCRRGSVLPRKPRLRSGKKVKGRDSVLVEFV